MMMNKVNDDGDLSVMMIMMIWICQCSALQKTSTSCEMGKWWPPHSELQLFVSIQITEKSYIENFFVLSYRSILLTYSLLYLHSVLSQLFTHAGTLHIIQLGSEYKRPLCLTVNPLEKAQNHAISQRLWALVFLRGNCCDLLVSVSGDSHDDCIKKIVRHHLLSSSSVFIYKWHQASSVIIIICVHLQAVPLYHWLEEQERIIFSC